MNAIVGVDIGGTKISAIVLGPDGDPTLTARVPTNANGPSGVYASVKQVLTELAVTNDNRAFGAIGVGIAGLVDTAQGTVSHAVNLGIGDEPLAIVSLLENDFDTTVYVENDVNAAAVGAFSQMSTTDDINDLAYLSIGTGIAAGLVLNGHIHRGRRGVAGEIGHFPIAANGPTCECGLQGCLEAVASGRAIERAWPVETGRSPAAELFAAKSRGDREAIALVDKIADHLAHAVHLLAVTYDVDRIVIGGGVAQVGRPLHDAITEGLHRLGQQSAFVRSLGLKDRVRPTPEGPIGAIGAAALAVEHESRATLATPTQQ